MPQILYPFLHAHALPQHARRGMRVAAAALPLVDPGHHALRGLLSPGEIARNDDDVLRRACCKRGAVEVPVGREVREGVDGSEAVK